MSILETAPYRQHEARPLRRALSNVDGATTGHIDGSQGHPTALQTLLSSRARPTIAVSKPCADPIPNSQAISHGHGLNREELRILAFIADGLSLDSVAVRMGMSSRTIRRRLRGVCDRLAVAQPIQAVVWVARRGLI